MNLGVGRIQRSNDRCKICVYITPEIRRIVSVAASIQVGLRVEEHLGVYDVIQQGSLCVGLRKVCEILLSGQSALQSAPSWLCKRSQAADSYFSGIQRPFHITAVLVGRLGSRDEQVR